MTNPSTLLPLKVSIFSYSLAIHFKSIRSLGTIFQVKLIKNYHGQHTYFGLLTIESN